MQKLKASAHEAVTGYDHVMCLLIEALSVADKRALPLEIRAKLQEVIDLAEVTTA